MFIIGELVGKTWFMYLINYYIEFRIYDLDVYIIIWIDFKKNVLRKKVGIE